MIIKEKKQVIETIGVKETNKFSIVASPKAFKIMTSNLYSDIILAVIRELSCNAYDAHVAIGRKNLPFVVNLPSHDDLSFYVEDFGPGMSHEDVMHLYTTFFGSNKTNSNDFVGALGLGSKSPFAYTNSFSVTSNYAGKQRIYTAYLDKNETPVISLLGEKDLDDKNQTGLKVGLVVKRDDVTNFVSKASEVFCWFKVPPKIINESFYKERELETFIKGKNWRIVKNQRHSYNSKGLIYAVMGNIAYPIKNSIHKLQEVLYNHTDIVIDFNIGDLDVAASRESIHYDEQTTENIKIRLEQIDNELTKMISEKKLDEIYSKWELICFLHKFSSYKKKYDFTSSPKEDFVWFDIITYKLKSNQKFKWRGQHLNFSKSNTVTFYNVQVDTAIGTHRYYDDIIDNKKLDSSKMPLIYMSFLHRDFISNKLNKKIDFTKENWDEKLWKLNDAPEWVRKTQLRVSSELITPVAMATDSYPITLTKNEKFITNLSLKLIPDDDTKIIIDDTESKGVPAKVQHYCKSNKVFADTIIKFANNSYKNKFIEEFDIPEDIIIYVSSMESPPKENRTKKQQPKMVELNISRYSRYGYRFSSLWSSVPEEEIVDNGIYVEIFRNHYAKDKKTSKAFDRDFEVYLEILRNIGRTIKIYGFKSDKIKSLNKNNWKTLESYTKEKLVEFLNEHKVNLAILDVKNQRNNDVSRLISTYKVLENFEDDMVSIIPDWDKISSSLKILDEIENKRLIINDKEIFLSRASTDIELRCQKMDINYEIVIEEEKQKFYNILKKLTKYKLASTMHYIPDSMKEEIRDHFILYIKAVEGIK